MMKEELANHGLYFNPTNLTATNLVLRKSIRTRESLTTIPERVSRPMRVTKVRGLLLTRRPIMTPRVTNGMVIMMMKGWVKELN